MESKTGEWDENHVEISLQTTKIFEVFWKRHYIMAMVQLCSNYKSRQAPLLSLCPHTDWDWSNSARKVHAFKLKCGMRQLSSVSIARVAYICTHTRETAHKQSSCLCPWPHITTHLLKTCPAQVGGRAYRARSITKPYFKKRPWFQQQS